MQSHKGKIAELYRRHFAELVAFLSRRVASRELATDLVQELFVRLLAREGSVAAVAHERGFLYQSVRHLTTEARRSPRWRDAAIEPDDGVADDEMAPPDTQVEDRQTVERLIKVIGRLPPRCRQAFILHKFENLSYAQVAEQLGISVSAVEKHMMRALDACREEVDRGPER